MDKEKFYSRLYASLVKTQLRRGQIQENAEDLAQQALANVLADMQVHPEKYPDEEAIRRVAHTAARNLLSTLANRDAMMKRRHVRIKNDEVFGSAANPSAENDYMKRRTRRRLDRALDEVPEKAREILNRVADGETITDIAMSIDVPRGTAGKVLSKARAKIKRFLKGHD